MAIKTIPITDESIVELYVRAKVKFVNEYPHAKHTDNNILKEVLKNYLGDD